MPGDGTDPGEPEVVVVAGRAVLADRAAARIVEAVETAVRARGRADVALTGGSSPPAIYRRLIEARVRDRVPWDQTHLWWGDERYVARDHPLSNAFLADETLLTPGGAPIPPDHIHPFPTSQAIGLGLGADWCAATYAGEVQRTLPTRAGWPVFDLVLLGVGGDGHILSVFARSEALTSDRLALAIPAPTHIEPHVPRVTLNPAIVVSAGGVLAMASGAGKAGVVARILRGRRDPADLPAVLARRSSATWIVDASAAAGLADGADAGHERRNEESQPDVRYAWRPDEPHRSSPLRG